MISDRPYQEPSPWLKHPLHLNGEPRTNKTASFVEYLRWMRAKSDDKQIDSGTLLDSVDRKGRESELWKG